MAGDLSLAFNKHPGVLGRESQEFGESHLQSPLGHQPEPACLCHERWSRSVPDACMFTGSCPTLPFAVTSVSQLAECLCVSGMICKRGIYLSTSPGLGD